MYCQARHELIVTLPVNHPPASGMEIKPATGEITQETAPAGRDDENLQEEWNDKNDNESQDIVEVRVQFNQPPIILLYDLTLPTRSAHRV